MILGWRTRGLSRLVSSSVNGVGASRISEIPRGATHLRLESKAMNDQTQDRGDLSPGRVEGTARIQTGARKRKWKSQRHAAEFRAAVGKATAATSFQCAGVQRWPRAPSHGSEGAG